jgi:hypothetical protein
LAVRDAPVGAAITLRCRGRGCPRPTPKPIIATGIKQISLERYFTRPLRAGGVLEVRVAATQMIAKVLRFRPTGVIEFRLVFSRA